MALKDLLLHIDNSPGYPARLELAINLARTHDAHLKGIYALSHSYYAPRHGSGEIEAARRAEELFIERTARTGISAEWLYVDWNVVGVSAAEIINNLTFYADLVIVGQPDNSTAELSNTFDLLERLGRSAGCPLLIVPSAGAYTVTGLRVMIAWMSGREASKSVKDAMPILKKAQHVSVVTVSFDGNDNSIDLNNAQKICSHLSQHQVQAAHEQIYAGHDITVGDLLLNHACEQKIDLLVIGAYAPSLRWGFVFSPVARHLINYMTVPILISH